MPRPRNSPTTRTTTRILQVSGDRVVWQGYDGNDFEIFTWRSGDAAPTAITDTAYREADPQVSGDRVAWEGFPHGLDTEIFTSVLGQPRISVTPTSLDFGTLAVGSSSVRQFTISNTGDGDLVVPSISSPTPDIRIAAPPLVVPPGGSVDVTVTLAPMTARAYLSQIAIAHNDPRYAPHPVYVVVYGRSVSTWSTTQLTTTNSAFGAAGPQVSADRVVWQQSDTPPAFPSTRYRIKTWKAGDNGYSGVNDNPYANINPQVCGDRVVWQCADGDGGDFEIYSRKTGGVVEKLSDNAYNDEDPQISGDRVVWYGYDGIGSDAEIYTWKVGDTAPTQAHRQRRPRLCAADLGRPGRLVWLRRDRLRC